MPLISCITPRQWEYAKRVGEEQHRSAIASGMTDYKASRRSGSRIHGGGVAGEIAVYNAFGLPVKRFVVGRSDGGSDIVLPSGAICQVKTPHKRGRHALFAKYDDWDIIDRMKKFDFLILVWPIKTGSVYRLVGYVSSATAIRCLRIWTEKQGARKTCYSVDVKFFNTDWMPFIRKHFYDWVRPCVP